MKPWTDRQRARSLRAALRHAIAALRPMTRGNYWINRAECARAAKAIAKAEKTLEDCVRTRSSHSSGVVTNPGRQEP